MSKPLQIPKQTGDKKKNPSPLKRLQGLPGCSRLSSGSTSGAVWRIGQEKKGPLLFFALICFNWGTFFTPSFHWSQVSGALNYSN